MKLARIPFALLALTLFAAPAMAELKKETVVTGAENGVIVAPKDGEFVDPAAGAALSEDAKLPAAVVASPPIEGVVAVPVAPAVQSLAVDPTLQPAQAVAVDPNLTFLELLFKSIGEMKGATVVGICVLVIQLLLKLINLPFTDKFFAKQKGWVKLLIVSGLTMIVTPLTLVQSVGLDWGAALVHSTTLAALMVFLNQIYLHVIKKQDA